MLAWQIDRVVREPQRHFIERKIRPRYLLGKDDVSVPVVASQRRAAIGTDLQLPDLEFLGRDRLVVRLDDRDLVKEPIGAAALGQELRALGIEDPGIDTVPVPGFAAAELLQIGCGEFSLVRHFVPLSFE